MRSGNKLRVFKNEAGKPFKGFWEITGRSGTDEFQARKISLFPGTKAPVFHGANGPVEGLELLEGRRSESSGHLKKVR